MDWKVDLGIFKKKKRIFLEGIYELEHLELDVGSVPVVEPVDVRLVLARARIGIALGGYVKAALEHPCTRRLTPVRLDINGTVEALYLPEEMREYKERLESLRNVIYYTNPVVDLGERIVEAIILEIPQKVLCRPDCKGLCPYCGANLNDEPDHVCQFDVKDVLNSKFAVLAKLKDRFREG